MKIPDKNYFRPIIQTYFKKTVEEEDTSTCSVLQA